MVGIKKVVEPDDSKWFFFMMLFLVIDFGRPQDFLPIGVIRPAMLTILILIYFIVRYKGVFRANYPQVRMIWYFILLLALLTPFAKNNFYAYQATTKMFMYMPFVISVVVLLNSIGRIRKFITLNLVLMIYIAIYSLTHGGIGSGNYFMDENDVSLYLNMWIPVCFFLLLYDKGKWNKILYVVGLVAALAAVVVSFSRGGFVGLVCVAGVIWLFSPKKMISLMILLLCTAVLYLFTGEEYKQEMATVTDTEGGTADDRLKSWATGWDMFIDNPLGVGGRNFAIRFPDYQGDRFKRGMWGRAAHSLWFTLIPEMGIIGIIIYFRLIYYNMRDLFRIKRESVLKDDDDDRYLRSLSIALIASTAGFFASATFISVLYYPHYWYLTGLIVAMSFVAKTRNELQVSTNA